MSKWEKKNPKEQSKQINFSPRISRHNSNENLKKKIHIGKGIQERKAFHEGSDFPVRNKSMGKHLYRSVKCILSKRS